MEPSWVKSFAKEHITSKQQNIVDGSGKILISIPEHFLFPFNHNYRSNG